MKAKATRLSSKRQQAPVLGRFTRPRPVRALLRERLFCGLDRAREHPAVWIAGPPGAGKTTLVSTYVAARRLRTVWYRMQNDDADPATFFHHFGLAVEAAALRGRQAPVAPIAPDLDLAIVARRYFEQIFLRLKAPCALVLDNYQEIPQDSPSHEAIREALESLPRGINLIVLSRTEPPPAFTAVRARGEIALFGAKELHLSAEECGQIARLREVPIGEPALQRLHQRTHGWAAGVVLALEQKVAPAHGELLPAEATPQVLFDYFAGDIFGKMAPPVQALLLRAALLPDMAAHRVVELTGAAQADRVLGELARSNYFTLKLSRLPGAPPAVYQFHPLFREFLLRRAQETLSPDALRALQLRAAALLEADGETAHAVALLLAARAWDDALPVILAHAPEMLQQGRGRILEGWLRALPTELLERTPWALYWLGRCRLGYDAVEARRYLERAFAFFEPAADAAGAFSAWASIVDSFIYERGDFSSVDRWIGVLDALRERHPAYPSPQVEAAVACSMFTALMYRQPERADLPQWGERVRAIVVETADVRIKTILGNQLMHYYTAWVGDLAAARLLIEAVRPPSASAAGPLAHIAGCAMAAKYHWYVGEHEESLRYANEGLETTRRYGARFSSLLETHGVYAHLTAGDVAAAERLLKETAVTASGGKQNRAQGHFLAFLCAFYRGDALHAITMGREAVALADAAGVPLGQGIYRAGLALALFGNGQRREAFACLAKARRIARRIRSPAVEFGCLYTLAYFLLERGRQRSAVPLLRYVMRMARERGYVNRLFWTPAIATRLFAAALEHGIEVPYVQDWIRARRLLPAAELAPLENWPFPVRVYTLGRFSVLIDGKPLEFSGKAQRKPLELLMALVAFGGRDVSERQLTEALWPDAEGDAAHQACAVALHRLRKLLGCDQAISLQSNHFSLDPRYVWVDVWALERALAGARLDAGGSARAVALYQGAFLGKHLDAPWAIPLRERLRVRFMRHLAEYGHALFEEGKVATAVELFEQGLSVDPLAEEFYRQLMVCYQMLDRRAEAIGVYQRCEKTLAAALGVPPAAKTVALYQDLQNY